jgi:hypothetical protein
VKQASFVDGYVGIAGAIWVERHFLTDPESEAPVDEPPEN